MVDDEGWKKEKEAMLKVITIQRKIISKYEEERNQQKAETESMFVANKEGVRFKDIGGLDEVIDKIQSFQHGILYTSLYDAFGINPPKGLMLYGPPGTGKTLIAKAMSNELEAQFAEVRTTDFMTKWLGEGERKLESMINGFQKYYDEHGIKVVVFFDEAESIFSRRGAGLNHESYDKCQGIILSYMDGFNSNNGLIFVGATNLIHNIDEAVLRPGRFDLVCEIPLPNLEGTLDILKKQVEYKERRAGRKIYDITNYEQVANLMHSKSLSGAQINDILRQGAERIIRTIIDYNATNIPYTNEIQVTQTSIEQILKEYKKPGETTKKIPIGFKTTHITTK